MSFSNLRLISGRANWELAKKISGYIGVELVDVMITEFADSEIFVRIQENVRGKDVFVIQSMCNPAYKNIMELLIIIDALRRSSAERITTVIPYFGYARQDRKAEPRVPITAKLVANLLTVAGADRVLTLDLHAAQIQGFFDIPVDNLYATPVFLETLKDVKNFSDYVVVSPDVGGVERSRVFARQIGASIAILDKRRARKNETEVLHLIGSVDSMNVFMIDDMIDTAGTIVKAAEMLRKKKARSISVYSTHAVLSGLAAEKIRDSKIDKLYLTDSIPIDENKRKMMGDKLVVLSVAELFGQAIERIHLNESVSSLFITEKKV